ncbi:MAG TPA: hypothetical protein GXX75_18775 [Clostridiales bacterium]|nr:hypothetical protein [Clostridiales bacterium]
MKLIDLFYGRNHNSTKGKFNLRNRFGEPVTVTKEIRYTVTDGQSNVHINGYDDLSEYCRTVGHTYRSGKEV